MELGCFKLQGADLPLAVQASAIHLWDQQLNRRDCSELVNMIGRSRFKGTSGLGVTLFSWGSFSAGSTPQGGHNR